MAAYRHFIIAAAASLLPTSPAHEHETSYVKYPLYDGYVRSCSQKEENFGFEETLEVRRYTPDIRSREWAHSNSRYRAGDGVHEATTSRVETRAYPTTDLHNSLCSSACLARPAGVGLPASQLAKTQAAA